MIQFPTTTIEQVWMERNKIWKGLAPSNCTDLSSIVNKLYFKYWKSSIQKKRVTNSPDLEWEPPPADEIKFNFDSTTIAVLRNSSSTITGAWVNHFNSDDPFTTKAEVYTQALQLATNLKLHRVIF